MLSYVNDISYNYFVKKEYNIKILNKNLNETKDEIKKVTEKTIEEKENNSFFGKVLEKFDSNYYEKKVDNYTKGCR